MLQRDDRPRGLGRPSLFSEVPDAPGEDKNILKQLDGLLAASGPATFRTRRTRGIVAGLLALCAVVAGLVWTSGRDEPPPAIVQLQPASPATPTAPLALPAASSPASASATASAAAATSSVPDPHPASTAAVPQKTSARDRTVDNPRGRSQRHTARTPREKPAAAAERRGRKAGARHASATHAKVRGKDKSVAQAERKAHGKRHQDTRSHAAGKHGARGKASVADSDAALIEAVITHDRAERAAQRHVRPDAGQCDPVKGREADAGRHPAKCKTKAARNKTA